MFRGLSLSSHVAVWDLSFFPARQARDFTALTTQFPSNLLCASHIVTIIVSVRPGFSDRVPLLVVIYLYFRTAMTPAQRLLRTRNRRLLVTDTASNAGIQLF